MNKSVFLLIIFTFVFSCRGFSGEEITLTLEETLALALRDNRDILLKAEDVLKAKLKVNEAKAGFLPTLNFTGARTNTRDYYSKNISQSTTQTTLNILRSRGLSVLEAVVNAGKDRLRPVLMTTITTIAGMLPLALSRAEGSEVWQPLGITMISGLSLSTLVTMLFIPTLYAIFETKR